MSKLAIENTTLTAIGDAIREKEGSTDLIPVGEIAARIGAMSGGGSTDDIFGTGYVKDAPENTVYSHVTNLSNCNSGTLATSYNITSQNLPPFGYKIMPNTTIKFDSLVPTLMYDPYYQRYDYMNIMPEGLFKYSYFKSLDFCGSTFETVQRDVFSHSCIKDFGFKSGDHIGTGHPNLTTFNTTTALDVSAFQVGYFKDLSVFRKLRYIDTDCFNQSSGIEIIDLPAIEDIQTNAFSNLASRDLLSGEYYYVSWMNIRNVSRIGSRAFKQNAGSTGNPMYRMDRLILDKCESIGEYAFQNCPQLQYIILTSPTQFCSLASTNAFSGTQATKVNNNLYVHENMVDQYKNDPVWSTLTASGLTVRTLRDLNVSWSDGNCCKGSTPS